MKLFTGLSPISRSWYYNNDHITITSIRFFSSNLQLQKWHNSDIENDVEVILEICSAIRQSKSVSNILRKHEPESNLFKKPYLFGLIELNIFFSVYLFCKENKWTENIRKHESNITKLTFSSNLQINQEPTDDKILAVESTVNHLCSFKIFTNSQVESKMSSINEKKLVKLENDLGKLLDRISSDKYRTTASDKVQRKNDEKVNWIYSLIVFTSWNRYIWIAYLPRWPILKICLLTSERKKFLSQNYNVDDVDDVKAL